MVKKITSFIISIYNLYNINNSIFFFFFALFMHEIYCSLNLKQFKDTYDTIRKERFCYNYEIH